MPTAADALFVRYRRTRDPECLAQVFDALAPRLLRLAIHLARDGAEDRVQATFLAAIERAEVSPAGRRRPCACRSRIRSASRVSSPRSRPPSSRSGRRSCPRAAT
ncbi:MAG: hypothetical protein EXS08_11605 [Planctomycetes bacterium]|nr:hypothetical protein [Planctomycetota bacterium]